MENGIKYMYFRDPLSPRVVTVARMIDGDKLHVSWCSNRILKTGWHEDKAGHLHEMQSLRKGNKQWFGDAFNRKTAHEVASGRITRRHEKTHAYEIQRSEDVKPIEQAVSFLMSLPELPTPVRETISRALEERENNPLHVIRKRG